MNMAREVGHFEASEVCSFCRNNTVDEFRFGKIYKRDNVIVHYFCLLTASHLQQNGSDKQGILGFLTHDIETELQSKSNSVCKYCSERGAVSVCAGKGCKVKFHFPCGIKNQTFHEFFGQYKSYCPAHRKVQVPSISSYSELTVSSICVVCQCDIEPVPCFSNVWASCCKTAWFHKDCVQRLALSAGYFFKCPNCNNQDDFRNEMLKCGIFIPDQDASWELEPNSFRELIERHSSCDAEKCLCDSGRNFNRHQGQWKIILCNTCGSQGIHNFCGKHVINKRGQWSCNICSPVLSKNPDEEKRFSPSSNDEEVSASQMSPIRKRKRRNSQSNNVNRFSTRNELSVYSLRNLPGTSSTESRYPKRTRNNNSMNEKREQVGISRNRESNGVTRKVRSQLSAELTNLMENFDIVLSGGASKNRRPKRPSMPYLLRNTSER